MMNKFDRDWVEFFGQENVESDTDKAIKKLLTGIGAACVVLITIILIAVFLVAI